MEKNKKSEIQMFSLFVSNIEKIQNPSVIEWKKDEAVKQLFEKLGYTYKQEIMYSSERNGWEIMTAIKKMDTETKVI